MADIFLSYSREDAGRAGSLVAEFEAHGWSVFWDRRIPAGKTWRSHIGAELQGARCIVVAWSGHSAESQWVAEEADEGKTRGVLVPVLFDRVQPPRGFREIQAADLADWQPGQPSERFTELIADLARLLGEGARASSLPPPSQPPASPPVREAPGASAPVAKASMRSLLVGGSIAAVMAVSAVIYIVVLEPFAERSPEAGSSVAPGAPASSNATDSTRAWIVVAGSFRRAARQEADQRRADLARAGIDATVVDSNRHALLAPDVWVTAVGPFATREAANAALPKVKAAVPDAYVKQSR